MCLERFLGFEIFQSNLSPLCLQNVAAVAAAAAAAAAVGVV
jgi:hypothetical protein